MSKFDSIRSKYAAGETRRQGKEFTRTESFGTGVESGLGWGYLDEAAGTKAAQEELARRKGVPEWLIKGTEFAVEKANPLGRMVSGTVRAATGIGMENLAPQDSRIMEDYRGARDARRDLEARASADNPLSYGGGYLTGAIASGPPIATGGKIVGGVNALKAGNVGKNAATIAKGVGKYGLEGAAYAGGTAFGSAEGDIGTRAKESVIPTAIGFGVGATLGPALQYVISPIAKGVGYHFLTPDDLKAVDMVIKRAERSGTDLKQVRADFDAWNKTGEVPETLAELMGPNERGLLSAVISANRETLERAGETFAERGRGEVTRLEDRMTAAMGATRDDFAKAEQAAAQARAQDPEPFYTAAHFDGGMQRKFLDQKDTEQFAYTLASNDFGRSTLGGAADYADMMQQPAVRDEIRAFAKALQDGAPPQRLSVQAADYIERAINRQYSRASQGQIQDIPAGIRALRDRLRAVVDPYGVGEARATAAERIRRGELLQEGRDFLKPSTDIEDINKTMRGDPDADIPPASDEGRRMYGVGATRAMSGELRNAPDMAGFANVARKLARTPAIREKVEAVRPKKLTKRGVEDQRYAQTRANQRLDEEIGRVANRAQFAVDMVGNSRTSFREADKLNAAADDTLQAAIGDAISDGLQGGPARASQNAWQKTAQAIGKYVSQPGAYNPRINRQIADILLAQGDQIPVQLQRLAQRQAQRNGLRVSSGASAAAINQRTPPMRSAGFSGPRGFGRADYRDLILMRNEGMDNVAVVTELGLPTSYKPKNLDVHASHIRKRIEKAREAGPEAYRKLADDWAITPDQLDKFMEIKGKVTAPNVRGEARRLLQEGYTTDAKLIPELRKYAERHGFSTSESALVSQASQARRALGLSTRNIDMGRAATLRAEAERLIEGGARSYSDVLNGLRRFAQENGLEIADDSLKGTAQRARQRAGLAPKPPSRMGIGEDVQSSLVFGLAGNAGGGVTGDTAGRFIDLNRDGVIDERDRQYGREMGQRVGSLAAGAPFARNLARGAGRGLARGEMTMGAGGRKPPKPPPIPGAGTGPKNRKHLGRGLKDLTDDNVIPMPPRKPANMGEGRTPEQLAGPYGGKPPSQWTPEEREFFVNSGHGSTADLDGGFAREYQTVDEVKKSLGRKGMKRANQGGQYDTEAMPVVGSLLTALGLMGGGAAIASHMSRNKSDPRIPRDLSMAREEAVKAVSSAQPGSREYQIATIRLQQIDREIARLQSGNPMTQALMPPSRKPVAMTQ